MAHQFKKKFGQNFLRDENLLKKIVSTAQIKNKHVIEIGPGEGGLTKYLVKEATMIKAYEIDESLKHTLEKLETINSNLEVIFKDFLSVENFDTKDTNIIGNIPYNITSPILFKILDIEHIISATFMVQKEFAERLSAQPNSKAYNALSVMMQLSFDVTYAFTVTKKVFYPIPKVDSAVITLKRTNSPNKELHAFIKDCFQQKRKTLLNNLFETRAINKSQTASFLEELGYSSQVRAEQIIQKDFIKLYSKTLT